MAMTSLYSIIVLALLQTPVFANTHRDEIKVLQKYIVERNPKISVSAASEVASVIVQEAKEAEISTALIVALVDEESTFKVGAVSKEGAVGLMQIHRKSHPDKKIKGIRNNIKSGIAILKENMSNSKNLKGALRRYSGGESNYPNRVIAKMNNYKQYRIKG